MAHEIARVVALAAARPWAIEEAYGATLFEALLRRAQDGPRAAPYRDEPASRAEVSERRGKVAVLRLTGSLAPRASAVRDVSAAFTDLSRFQVAFRAAANDAQVSAILLDVDSPGGMVDLVPETAALVRGARREGRPIVAVANTMMASAAYWIGSQADRVVASPSAVVGSIGVRAMHTDYSRQLEALGVKVTHIHAGARKVEGSPYRPLDKQALGALQAEVDAAYDAFVGDVAAARGVSPAVVRADPEAAERHMGGGRTYRADRARTLGMVDEVDTFDAVLRDLSGGRSTRTARARLSLA